MFKLKVVKGHVSLTLAFKFSCTVCTHEFLCQTHDREHARVTTSCCDLGQLMFTSVQQSAFQFHFKFLNLFYICLFVCLSCWTVSFSICFYMMNIFFDITFNHTFLRLELWVIFVFRNKAPGNLI